MQKENPPTQPTVVTSRYLARLVRVILQGRYHPSDVTKSHQSLVFWTISAKRSIVGLCQVKLNQRLGIILIENDPDIAAFRNRLILHAVVSVLSDLQQAELTKIVEFLAPSIFTCEPDQDRVGFLPVHGKELL
jgi:hypothetical protein